ncbi:ribonuclease III domain-containing protein, partial [Acinetobacter baumannii]
MLGLAIAEWLYERFAGEPEGALSRRLNALVTGPMCANVAREVGVPPLLRLGKQARGDGAADSDNVLGDAMEALIGALYLEFGFAPARD